MVDSEKKEPTSAHDELYILGKVVYWLDMLDGDALRRTFAYLDSRYTIQPKNWKRG